jgi:hypothetical protein
MVSPGWQNNLVGKSPTAGAGTATGFPTMCAGMGMVYLNAGSNPATGLFLDKINPSVVVPCGAHMPYLQANLTMAQFACIQSWANTLTNQ